MSALRTELQMSVLTIYLHCNSVTRATLKISQRKLWLRYAPLHTLPVQELNIAQHAAIFLLGEQIIAKIVQYNLNQLDFFASEVKITVVQYILYIQDECC